MESAEQNTGRRWIFGAAFLVVLAAAGLFLFGPKNIGGLDILGLAHLQPKSYSQILEENANFSKAVSLIRDGGDLKEAQRLLQQEQRAAERAGEYDVAGTMQLYVAATQATNAHDPQQLREYAETLVAVATNEQYHQRTRTYAYAFIGELFSRLLALNDSRLDPVLDVIVDNPKLAVYKMTKDDGTVDYRGTAITILRVAASINVPVHADEHSANPLVSARLASLIARSVELGEFAVNEQAATMEEVRRYLTQARDFEHDLREPDTTLLYPAYVFLLAQTVGIATLVDGGAYAAKFEGFDAEQLFTDAITAARAAADPGIESSARYGYAKYLVGTFSLKPDHTSAEEDALGQQLDELLAPLAASEALRTSPQVRILMSIAETPVQNPSTYQTLVAISSYSDEFSKLVGIDGK